LLLRSVIKHVREQNWFAVGLDFLIVVVGVFIGIQVSNWNEARNEAALERAIIQSLKRDFIQILSEDNERYLRTIAAPEDLARLIDAIGAGQAPEPSVGWRGVEAALLAYATTPPSPTYDELLSTGRLSRLSNAELRQQLGEFERSRLNEDGLVTYLVQQSFGSPVYERVDLDPRHVGLGLSGSYRWDSMDETLPYLQERVVYINALASWRQNSHDHAQRILRILEAEGK